MKNDDDDNDADDDDDDADDVADADDDDDDDGDDDDVGRWPCPYPLHFFEEKLLLEKRVRWSPSLQLHLNVDALLQPGCKLGLHLTLFSRSNFSSKKRRGYGHGGGTDKYVGR